MMLLADCCLLHFSLRLRIADVDQLGTRGANTGLPTILLETASGQVIELVYGLSSRSFRFRSQATQSFVSRRSIGSAQCRHIHLHQHLPTALSRSPACTRTSSSPRTTISPFAVPPPRSRSPLAPHRWRPAWLSLPPKILRRRERAGISLPLPLPCGFPSEAVALANLPVNLTVFWVALDAGMEHR